MTEPSLKFTRTHDFGDLPTSRTEYIRGRNTRSEYRTRAGKSATVPPTNIQYEYGPLRADIQNRDLNYRFQLDLEAHLYAAIQMNQHGGPRWARPVPINEPKPSGRTMHVHVETTDTGERREIFGYTARRVITKTRQSRDAELMSESERDGWYIDPPLAWRRLHPPNPGIAYQLASLTGEKDDFEFTETGPREDRFALLSTRIHRSYFHDGSGNQHVSENVDHEEITEISEALLAPDLFVPPPGFKRVPLLTRAARYGLKYRLRHQWERWKDALTLPGRIARFRTGSPLY